MASSVRKRKTGRDQQELGYQRYSEKRYKEAESGFCKSLQERESVLGPEHVDTLHSKHWLGLSLSEQKKYDEAEGLLREAAQGREKTLGAEHDDTLDSKYWLGLSLYEQKKYEEAEGLLREAARGREKTLGAEHDDTLDSKYWLGLSLYEQKKYEEAEGLLREAARGREKTLGAEHDDTLESKHWVGLSLYRQEKYEEAEGSFREAVQGQKKTLGAEHADTLYIKYWLGLSLYRQEKYEEAEGSFREAAQGREKTLGAEHADTLHIKYWLGLSLYEQKKYEEADGLLREVLSISGRTRGANHLLTTKSTEILQNIKESRLSVRKIQPTGPLSQSAVPSLQPREGQEQTLAERLDAFFDARQSLAPYADSEVYELLSLLKQAHPAWSRAPRIYIILRTIGQLDLLNEFIQLGFSDHWLPLTEQALPRCLRPNARAEFKKTQELVLTKSADLEKGGNGEHCHFQRGDPLPFERKELLGRGGFGQVERVISLLSFQEYALKRVRRDTAFGGRRSEATRQFVIEIEVLKRIRHDHIVQFVGSYTDHKYIGLLMSPVAERDLAAYLKRIDISKGEELRTFFGCLARALEFLHGENIRHKDIAPGNILVHQGNVLFTDFGLSLDYRDASGSTTMGMVNAMNPRYCAPEVAQYEPRNSKSDIWSLGVVFLDMVSVLKGESVEYIGDYLRTNGTKNSFVRTNEPAKLALIDELKVKGEHCDNRILSWVQEMTQIEQDRRPTAAELIRTITTVDEEGQGLQYCGICCVTPDESSSGSDDEWEPTLR